jgi:hypothetical protein
MQVKLARQRGQVVEHFAHSPMHMKQNLSVVVARGVKGVGKRGVSILQI